MPVKLASTKRNDAPWYRGADVPLSVIRRFTRALAAQFQPEKIVLFGSHLAGTAHDDSDVDLLVIMPCRNTIDQACRIDAALDPPFPLDLVVMTPTAWKRRLAHGEAFATAIVQTGKVLYEANDRGMGAKSRGRLSVRSSRRRIIP